MNLLSLKETETLIQIIKLRFEKNMERHPDAVWISIEEKLLGSSGKLWSLNQMEITGGEPDVVLMANNEYAFVDCALESPKGRRSLCYDRDALDARKENKPAGNAIETAQAMGVDLLSKAEYETLQHFGRFDEKTSSWIKTPEKIRKLGGALFADLRYDTVFVYHNGAQSYYAARGFRAKLAI